MNPWRGLKNIPHNVWILAFATLINRAGTMVLPFLSIYLIKEIGLSAGQAGLVIACYGLGGLISAPFIGKLSDKIGALAVMKASLFFTGVMLFGYSFITNFYLILFYTLIWSVIGEAFRPANLSLISTEAQPDQRKIAFALNRLAINAGMSIGPVAGGFLSVISFHLLFYVDGITSILAAVFLAVSHFDKKKNESGEKENTKDEIVESRTQDVELNKNITGEKHKSILYDKRYLLFMISLLPASMVFFQHIGAMPIYLVRDLGFKETIYGIMMSINTGLIIFIEVPLNNAMARWDDRKAIAFGAFLCALGFGAMSVFTSLFLVIITVVIWTFGEMIFFPAIVSYASAISPEERRGEYMGYFQMIFSLSIMIGPWAGNEILDNYGAFTLWVSVFFFCLLTPLMMLFFKKHTGSLAAAK